jgi:hypothetical protein
MQQKVLEEQLIELEAEHERLVDKLKEERSIENKLSIQEVADMLAVDKKSVEDRVLTRKAQKMVDQLMKNFK